MSPHSTFSFTLSLCLSLHSLFTLRPSYFILHLPIIPIPIPIPIPQQHKYTSSNIEYRETQQDSREWMNYSTSTSTRTCSLQAPLSLGPSPRFTLDGPACLPCLWHTRRRCTRPSRLQPSSTWPTCPWPSCTCNTITSWTCLEGSFMLLWYINLLDRSGNYQKGRRIVSTCARCKHHVVVWLGKICTLH